MSDVFQRELAECATSGDIASFASLIQESLLEYVDNPTNEYIMSALQEYAAAHKEEMNRVEVINVLSAVFSDCQKRSLLHTSPEVYLKLIAFLITVIENRNTIPIFVFHLYLEDSCSSRKWVDEKKYRAFVTKLISVFKYAISTKGCPYSEAELHSIFTLAVDYMSPLVERPLSQIVDGIVMTSCTLSSIPSFTVR
ncbi:hypothetical protein WA556_002583, partial [Blastocystis sp. ATCC 50177/Nand II]